MQLCLGEMLSQGPSGKEQTGKGCKVHGDGSALPRELPRLSAPAEAAQPLRTEGSREQGEWNEEKGPQTGSQGMSPEG